MGLAKNDAKPKTGPKTDPKKANGMTDVQKEAERVAQAELDKKELEKKRKAHEPIERGKKFMLGFPSLLRDIDALAKDITTKNYKNAVPEKYLKEFGGSLQSHKKLLLSMRGQFESINFISDAKAYAKKSIDFLVPAEEAVIAAKQTVKAAKATMNVYLNAAGSAPKVK